MSKAELKFKTEFLAKLREWLCDGKARHPALIATYSATAEKLARELAA